MSDIKFPVGIRFFRPHEKAPDFVKGNISIDRDEFITWLSQQGTDEDGRVKLDLKKSQKGTLYMAVNEYGVKKPKDEELEAVRGQAMASDTNRDAEANKELDSLAGEDNSVDPDDIPF